jgi:hypothetical protein
MKEKQRHIDAFEIYFQQKQKGQSTTAAISSLKSECKVSEKTLWKWKKEFNWDDREAIRSAEIQKNIEKKINKKAEDHRVRYLEIINNALGTYYNDVANKKRPPIEVKNSGDVVRLIKCGAEILGFTEDKQDINISIVQNKEEKLEKLREIEKDGQINPFTTPTKLKESVEKDNGE